MISCRYDAPDSSPIGDLDQQERLLDGSGMNREVHVPFCERLRGKFPRSTHLTAIPALLDMLEVSGCIVSIDAMGCQKAIAEKIREKNAHYLLAVKGNQQTTLTQ